MRISQTRPFARYLSYTTWSLPLCACERQSYPTFASIRTIYSSPRMFSFDNIDLPTVERRMAFIGIDFQNDFTNQDGALPVAEPEGYLARATQLAEAFRGKSADIIWTQTISERTVPLDEEEILASDIAPSRQRPSSRRALPKIVSDDENGAADPEAFLSRGDDNCPRASTKGCELATEVKSNNPKRDIVITKAGYSAFKGTQLLRTLRSKMVMDLYICGSLANIGVYATALEAAQHGIAVTLIEDCCGYRSTRRKEIAFHSLAQLIGCEILSADEVHDILQPPPKGKTKSRKSPSRESASTKKSNVDTEALISNMSGLDLGADKAKKADASVDDGAESQRAASKTIEPSSSKTNDAAKPVDTATQSDKSGGATVIEVRQATNIQIPRLLSEDLPSISSKPSEVAAEGITSQSPKTSTLGAASVDDLTAKLGSVTMNNLEPDTGAEEKALQRGLCSGDTDVIDDLLPDDIATEAFETLKDEVDWQRMSHQGGEVPRLVAVQGDIGEDGSMPVYRHPSDESPPLLEFTPTVLKIKAEAEKQLGHPLNHALIQFYRDGTDYISEHSDKTIDVVKGSYIANVSLGAQRTMVLRKKRVKKVEEESAAKAEDIIEPELKTVAPTTSRTTERATLRHNSLCRMGLKTNMEWMHAIRRDNRAPRDKNVDELAFSGARISLTFRHIGTFLNKEQTLIWGQGATGKTREEAHEVINGQGEKVVGLLKAFGMENQSPSFDWDKHYGEGFDVLHMSAAIRFFSGRDETVNMRVRLMFAEFGLGYAKGNMAAGSDGFEGDAAGLRIMDNDEGRSVVDGDVAIMLYMDGHYNPVRKEGGGSASRGMDAVVLTRFQKGMAMLRRLRQWGAEDGLPKSVKDDLKVWNGFLKEAAEKGEKEEENKKHKEVDVFVAGTMKPSLADFAFWPVLHEVYKLEEGILKDSKVEALEKYYGMMLERESVKKVLGLGKDGK